MVQEKVCGALQQRRQQLLLGGGEAAQHMGLHCVRVCRAPNAYPQPWHCLWRSRGAQVALVRSVGAPHQTTRPRAGLTLELRQLMQERTPLWPLQGYGRGSQCFGASAPGTLPSPGWGQHTYPTAVGRPTSLSQPDRLRASPGASPQLQSQLPQGLVQLIVHQVDLRGSQPEQLRLAQGNGGPGYC